MIRKIMWSDSSMRAITTVIFVLATILGFGYVWLTRPIAFDPHLWRTSDDQRHRMVEGLIAQRLFEGKERIEVERLLGMPKGTDYVDAGNYIYWTGSDGIDDRWLEVGFTDDRVSSVRYYPD